MIRIDCWHLIWFLLSESTNWSVSAKGCWSCSSHQTGQFGGFHVNVLVEGQVRSFSRLVRHVSNSTGIWAQGDPNSRHKTASRPARSRGRQAMTPQCQDVHYCQWMSEMVLSRPPKGQESQIMTSMSCRATYQRFIPTSNRWLHGKVQYTTGSGGVLVCLK